VSFPYVVAKYHVPVATYVCIHRQCITRFYWRFCRTVIYDRWLQRCDRISNRISYKY
jgi:hypothetical protein